MEEEKRNLMLFFMISVFIMVGYPYFFSNQSQNQVLPHIAQNTFSASSISTNSQNSNHVFISSEEEKTPQNILLESQNLSGIISSRGVKIEDISLKKYKEDLDEKLSRKVSVFGKKDEKYHAFITWKSDDVNVSLPNDNTVWNVDNTNLSENSIVKLSWDNKSGLFFERRISVDENFMLTITDVVKNYGTSSIPLKSIAKIHREFDKDLKNTWTSYEGPLGCIGGKVEEIAYEDIVKKGEIRNKTLGGWFGITDKYWLVAFVPNKDLDITISYLHSTSKNKNIYNIESSTDTIILSPNSEVTRTYNLFVGAKEIKTLDMYEKKIGAMHFDLAIDFGYLYFLTKPLLYSLAFVKDIVGNMGLGIILITLLIKLLLLPLSNKSYHSMNRMKAIQPKIQALQKKYADDKVKLGQEVSAIYQKEGVNPLGGCLPTLLQSPVLFALYKVLYISIEMRHAPFFGWIHDLSLPDPLSIFNLFGIIPIDLPGFLQIGIWPILMGLSMFLQQKMSPAPADPTQANMILIMPIVFTFMFAQFPSGLVIYWTFSNILSIAHQYFVMKQDKKARLQKSKEI